MKTSKMRTLTIRLLRSGWAPQSAFADRFAPGGSNELRAGQWNDLEGASFYVGQIYSNPPSWIAFLQQGGASIPGDLFAGGAGAVIFLPVKGRVMAICFGHIHLALNEDAFERQFGLKVTLNSVPRNQLRTLDLATPDAVTFQKRVQASKDSDLQGFGVDMLRDLARVAGGTPSDVSFARFVAGKDSLSITSEFDAAVLPKKCEIILDVYTQTTYRTEFAWVDNMRVVIEKSLIAKLDSALSKAIQDLRDGKNSDLHMAPPEVVNYTEGAELHYNGFGSHGTVFYSLSIGDYVAELNRCEFSGGIADIKDKHHIRAKGDGSEVFSERWRVYDCFVFEASTDTPADQQFFVLFAGSWYQVERGFKSRIEAFYASIPRVKIIGSTSCRNEAELIKDLDVNRPDLLMLDQVKINPAGVRYANLEPCDFLSNKKHFIHLKDGHSSGPISHLWSQGVVSVEAFLTDAEFRKKLRSEVQSRKRGFEKLLPKSTEKVLRDDYFVVFGIMRKPFADGSIGLPFFSKVSLQAAAERIAQFGIALAIELIEKPASDDDQVEENNSV